MKRSVYILSCLLLCITSLIVLSACSESHKHKINFIVNEEIYQTISTNGNESINMPENPSMEGYKFEGWYFDKNIWEDPFTKDSFLDIKLTKDIFVYSKWIENDELEDTDATFEGFEKSGDSYIKKVANNVDYLDISHVISIAKDSFWTLNTDIECNNHINSKVAPLNIGDNTYYVLVTDKNQNVKMYTLKIRRKSIYDINFMVDDIVFLSQQIEEDEYLTQPLQCPEKIGYDFIDWDFDFSSPISGDCRINAKFILTSYNISYYLNEGNNNSLNPNIYTMETEFILQEPTRNGFQFIGWYDNSNYDGYPITTIQKNSTGNIKLYARWIEYIYTENYKPIYTTEEFITFLSNSDNWSKNVRLFADLDFENKTIPTIGRYDLAYSAVFDGNGFCVKNTTKSLFQYFSGTLKNLGVMDINIENGRYYNKNNCAGGLVAYNKNGIIMDCYTTGKIKAIGVDTTYVGGIVGYSEKGAITNCYSTATIYAEHYCGGLCHDAAYAGGIVGYSVKTSIENIYFTGYVSAYAEYLLYYHANSIVASGLDENVKNYYCLNNNTELVDIYSYVVSNWNNKVWNLYNNNNPTLIKNSIKKRL